MNFFIAPHEVRDQEKLSSMIDTIVSGSHLPPVVVLGDTAFTGSHRIAAYLAVEKMIDNDEIDIYVDEIPHVEIEDADYCSAMEDMDLEPGDDISDYNDFCAALYSITDDDGLKAALEDQMD